MNQHPYEPYYPPQAPSYQQSKQQYYAKIYGIMALGLLLTFGVAYLVSRTMWSLIYNPLVMIILLLVEVGIVWNFSRRLLTASYQSVIGMFVVYAILNGVTMSSIFIVFQLNSIYFCFLTAAASFGLMALFGHNTKRDLSPLRGILISGLIGLILMTLVGFLFRLAALEIVICCIGIVLFLGLTAYDTQKLSQMYDAAPNPALRDKFAVFGALQLYLDFINLFQYILILFGGRRRQ